MTETNAHTTTREKTLGNGRRFVAIAGATGGIGEALAAVYAPLCGRLSLSGRKEAKLLDLKRALCKAAAHCTVTTDAFDFREEDRREGWCRRLVEEGCDTLILCAGVSASVEPTVTAEGRPVVLPERSAEIEREMNVNATANILAANTFAAEWLKQNAGCGRKARIVLVASLAALTGLPGSPGYSASKAALRTYGEALRRLTEAEGLSVTVLCPGYIESEMSRRYQGAKPSLMTAETAALRMKNAIEAGRDEYAFPWHLAFGIRLLGLIPKCLQSFFLKGFFFTVVPDEESKAGRVSAMESATASKEKSERAA